MDSEKQSVRRLLLLFFWGENNRCQPWLGIFWLIIAVGIWSYIFGFWQNDSGGEVIVVPNPSVFEANATGQGSAYQRLMDQGARNPAERLNNWKKNFPWKPIKAKSVQFDPNRHLLSRVRPLGVALESGGPIGIADYAIADHNVALRRFFQNEARFSKQFEQSYHVLADYGMTNNPVLAGRTFQALWDYKKADARARKEPDATAMEPVIETTRLVNPITGESEVVGTKVRDWKPYPPNPETGENMTWSERAEFLKEGIVGSLLQSEWLSPLPYQEEKAQAYAIRDRLIREVEHMADLPDPGFFGSFSPEENALNGSYWSLMEEEHSDIDMDILVPYPGWVEAMQSHEEQFDNRMAQSVAEGDPSLKALRPDLFPLAGIVDNILVDKDGEPLRIHEGFEGFLISNGKPFPLLETDDGSINVPTPTQIQELNNAMSSGPADN